MYDFVNLCFSSTVLLAKRRLDQSSLMERHRVRTAARTNCSTASPIFWSNDSTTLSAEQSAKKSRAPHYFLSVCVCVCVYQKKEGGLIETSCSTETVLEWGQSITLLQKERDTESSKEMCVPGWAQKDASFSLSLSPSLSLWWQFDAFCTLKWQTARWQREIM